MTRAAAGLPRGVERGLPAAPGRGLRSCAEQPNWGGGGGVYLPGFLVLAEGGDLIKSRMMTDVCHFVTVF